MSEDSKDNPPAKLTLSRGLKAQADTEAAKVKADAKIAKVSKPAPAMKLKRREELPKSSASAPGEAPTATKSAQTPPLSDEAPAQKKPSFDPKNPFGNSIKAGEIKAPIQSPSDQHEQHESPTLGLDDGSSVKAAKAVKCAKVEQAINSLNSEEEQVQSKSILPSVIIIIILLIILAAAGFGLWKILNLSQDVDASTAAVTSAESAESSATAPKAPKNPIEKAKAAIAQVPGTDVDAITQEPSAPVSLPAIIAETEVTATLPVVPEPDVPNSIIETNKQAVSQYLSNIHIGGLRKGERPMVILGGERFDVGDIVQAETGLKFDGLRNGRLAFRDHHGIVYLKSF
ncbi:hypothetical protein ACWPKO_18130 [Coraliomargarita sp. W4R53]